MNAGLRYDFDKGPGQVASLADARRSGINCVALAHLALERIQGHRPPPELHCYEMYADTSRFSSVDPAEIDRGDLIFFGETEPGVPPDQFKPCYDSTGYLINWEMSPVTHVAVATGERLNGEALLLHASPKDGGGTSLWPVSRFREHQRYARIRRVARVVHNGLWRSAG